MNLNSSGEKQQLSLSLSSPCIRPLGQDGMTDISTTMGLSQQMGISEVHGTGLPQSGAGQPVFSRFTFLFPTFDCFLPGKRV